MNDAYKTEGDTHVHWHVRPRYEEKVIFEGVEFVDEKFGHHYNSSRNKIISEEIREKIVERIAGNFGD